MSISVGERIRRARMGLGLTQTELGEKLALGLRQIQKIEKGETAITLDRLEEISKTLSIPLSYFLATAQNEEEFSFDISKNGQGQHSKKESTREPRDGIVCEYTRNEETLRLVFPPYISTEDLKEKVEVLVKGILGTRTQEKE